MTRRFERPGERLVKEDKDGTRHYESDVCPKCNGYGHIYGYEYVDGGVCFKCRGTGRHYHRWVEKSQERLKKEIEKRIKRDNAKFLANNGFNEAGETWLIDGNAYERREELKKAGAKFMNGILWHSPYPIDGFHCEMITVDEVVEMAESGKIVAWLPPFELQKVRLNKFPIPDVEKGNYVGEIDEKVELELKFVSKYEVEGWSGGVDDVYVFVDDHENLVKWETGSIPDWSLGLDPGFKGIFKATVKRHRERGDGRRETWLKRVKLIKSI